MAREVIGIMQRENPCENKCQQNPMPNKASTNWGSEINSREIIAPLEPSTSYLSQKYVGETPDDNQLSSPAAYKANIPNIYATPTPVNSINSYKSFTSGGQELDKFEKKETDKDETPVPLSSEISCAIRLS